MEFQVYNSYRVASAAVLLFKGIRNFLGLFSVMLFSCSIANAQVAFQDVTSSVGGPFHIGESWGASWGHIDEDVYPDLFVSNHAMKSSLLLNNGNGSFSDVIDTADLSGALTSPDGIKGDIHGGAWADFDNDGDQDLFVTRSSGGSTVYLLQNNGFGEFVERRQTYGTGAIGGGRVPMLFDYDNDGRLDLAVSGNEGNDLFKWNGYRFVDRSASAGVIGKCLGGHSLGFSDFFPNDSGGAPVTPIYFCNSPSRNIETAYDTSTFPFTDVSSKFDIVGTTPDTLVGDFNNDLKMDMFTLRGNRTNSGAAKISNTRVEAWMAEWGGDVNYFSSFSFTASGPITIDLAARTTDNPSKVYIGGTSGVSGSGYQPSSVPFTLHPSDSQNWGGDSEYAPNYLRSGVHIEFDENNQKWTFTLSSHAGGDGVFFKIDGNGFSNVTTSGLGSTDFEVSPSFFLNNGNRLASSGSRGIGAVMCGGMTSADFDNDMDLDIYLVCKSAVGNIENRLYLNNGAGFFSLVSSTGAEGILGQGVDSGAGTGETAITADYDIDGFMDLFVTNGSRLFPHFHKDGYTAGGPDQFFRNISNNGNNWIQIDLEGNGVDTNRDAIGAKVFVTAGGITQLREQNGKLHRWSHDHKRLHFGLANNTSVDIEVRWPNGDIDNHYGVTVNKLYKVTQNVNIIDVTPNGGSTTPTLSINNASLDEGDTAILTINLSAASTSTVFVNYQTNQQTALSGIDYSAASGVLTFNPGETSKTISVATIQDADIESEETFTVTLNNVSGASIIQNTGTVTIFDDDSGNGGGSECGQPNYSFSNLSDRGLYIWQDCATPQLWSIRAISGGGSFASFDGTIESSQVLSNLVPVSLESTDSVVLSNGNTVIDYTMIIGGPWQDGFNFNALSGADLCLVLNSPGLSIYYGVNSALVSSPVNLNDRLSICNTGNSLPTISIDDISVSEDVGTADVSLNLSTVSTESVSVSYATMNGSALDGLDYLAASGVIDFLPGELVKTILIPITQDTINETTEQFTLVLSAPINALTPDIESVITITDDDSGNGGGSECGQPSYSLSNLSDRGLYVWQDCAIPELWSIRAVSGGGSATNFDGTIESSQVLSNLVPVSLESTDSVVLSNGNTVIDYTMIIGGPWQDGFNFNALSGADLCLVLNSPGLSIYYGVNSALVSSPVNLNDRLSICNTGNSLPTISIDDISVSEDVGTADVSLNLSTVSTESVSVSYATMNGSALDGLDYLATSGVIDFLPGELVKTISIPIIEDAINETTEQFTLVLSAPINALTPDIDSVISIDEAAGINSLVCGQPSFTPIDDAGIFIWKDCGLSDSWYITVSGGAIWDSVAGSIVTNSPVTSVEPLGFESSDSYQLTNGDQLLEFNMGTGGGWTDGLKFDFGLSGSLCLDVTSTMSNPIIVGSDNTIVASPINLNTLEACQ